MADRIIEVYSAEDSPRKVHLFEVTSEDGTLHYGCRYYENQVYQFDNLFPGLSESDVVELSKSWVESPHTIDFTDTLEK